MIHKEDNQVSLTVDRKYSFTLKHCSGSARTTSLSSQINIGNDLKKRAVSSSFVASVSCGWLLDRTWMSWDIFAMWLNYWVQEDFLRKEHFGCLPFIRKYWLVDSCSIKTPNGNFRGMCVFHFHSSFPQGRIQTERPGTSTVEQMAHT